MRSERLLRLLHVNAALLVVAAAPAPGQSGQQPQGTLEKQITVSANRDEVPLSEVGSAITVIEGEEIELRSQLTVSDLLRTVSGVEVVQTGGAGKSTSVRLRGGSSVQALILVDGVRLNTVTGSDVDFANLTADNIERIEVLRGPQAAYGSEAMSGVISITTARGGDGFKGSLFAESGSREHQRYGASVSGGSALLDFSASATDLSTDTVSQITGGEETDPYENTTYTGRLGAAFAEDGRVDLSVRSYEGDVSLDGFGTEDLNAAATTEGESIALSAEKSILPKWRQTLRVSQSTTDILGADPDTFFNNYDIRSESTLLEAQADFTLAAWNTLNVGVAHEERDGLNVGGFDESAELDSWFIQDQWSPNERVHLTGSLRRDDHSVFGDETSYRFTGTTSFADGRTRIHGSMGTAFRAPNFNELFFPFAGDRNLRPETSAGWDLGVRQSFLSNRLNFDLAYFDLEFDDLIQFDLTTFLFGNVARATSSGVEFLAEYRHKALALTLTHTYNETEDGATGAPLARRPQNRTTFVALASPAPRLDLGVMFMSVNDRIDSTGLDMDDYNRVDLSVRYQALSWLRPFLRAENALDEDYEEVPGFTTPGATFIVGVSLFK